jgi:hypothetical protein
LESLLENDFGGSRVEEKERAESQENKQTKKKKKRKRKRVRLSHCCFAEALCKVFYTTTGINGVEVGGRPGLPLLCK